MSQETQKSSQEMLEKIQDDAAELMDLFDIALKEGVLGEGKGFRGKERFNLLFPQEVPRSTRDSMGFRQDYDFAGFKYESEVARMRDMSNDPSEAYERRGAFSEAFKVSFAKKNREDGVVYDAVFIVRTPDGEYDRYCLDEDSDFTGDSKFVLNYPDAMRKFEEFLLFAAEVLNEEMEGSPFQVLRKQIRNRLGVPSVSGIIDRAREAVSSCLCYDQIVAAEVLGIPGKGSEVAK
ncbi:MAG: hypothetical protein ABII07_03255 [Patescibacteria group bacterium]|nr:hypothetical protein [Patescibacteria group bacterium]